MNNRFMRILLFFDLPMETSKNRHDYSVFHKFLLKNGFIMMQKSVYTRLVINNVTSKSVRDLLNKNLPPKGTIELLEITENQFSNIEYLSGERQKLVIDSMDRLIEI